MSATFRLARGRGLLIDAAGRCFDPVARRWGDGVTALDSETDETVDAIAAVAWLQRESGNALAAALQVGELLGDCRLSVICGGRGGVMQAVCEGVARVGGLSIGLLPDADAGAANRFVGVAVATGIGEARNALIARAACCLIAIGDSFGTLSEVALGRQFGKLVIGLEGAPDLQGVRHAAGARDAVQMAAESILAVS